MAIRHPAAKPLAALALLAGAVSSHAITFAIASYVRSNGYAGTTHVSTGPPSSSIGPHVYFYSHTPFWVPGTREFGLTQRQNLLAFLQATYGNSGYSFSLAPQYTYAPESLTITNRINTLYVTPGPGVVWSSATSLHVGVSSPQPAYPETREYIVMEEVFENSTGQLAMRGVLGNPFQNRGGYTWQGTTYPDGFGINSGKHWQTTGYNQYGNSASGRRTKHSTFVCRVYNSTNPPHKSVVIYDGFSSDTDTRNTFYTNGPY